MIAIPRSSTVGTVNGASTVGRGPSRFPMGSTASCAMSAATSGMPWRRILPARSPGSCTTWSSCTGGDQTEEDVEYATAEYREDLTRYWMATAPDRREDCVNELRQLVEQGEAAVDA